MGVFEMDLIRNALQEWGETRHMTAGCQCCSIGVKLRHFLGVYFLTIQYTTLNRSRVFKLHSENIWLLWQNQTICSKPFHLYVKLN